MGRTVKNAYTDHWAEDYDANRFVRPQGQAFHRLELEQLEDATQQLPVPSEILEVGCGTGRFLQHLADQGHRVTGLDPSQDMLDLTAKKLGNRDHCTLVCGQGAELPFEDNHFDFVYSIRVLNQTESEAYAYRVIDEIARVTKPGKRMLIEFTNRFRPYALTHGVALSLRAVRQHVESHDQLEMADHNGMLLFSQTLLDKMPRLVLPGWMELERWAGRKYPHLTTRCYVLLSKKSEA